MSISGSSEALWKGLWRGIVTPARRKKPPPADVRAAVRKVLAPKPTKKGPTKQMVLFFLDEMDAFLPRGTLGSAPNTRSTAGVPKPASPSPQRSTAARPASSPARPVAGAGTGTTAGQSQQTTPKRTSASQGSQLRGGGSACVDALYTLFELANCHGSRLVLVGMANAIDMVNRALPKLPSLGLKHSRVLFSPYSQAQVRRIVEERLQAVARHPLAPLPKQPKQDASAVESQQSLFAPGALDLLSKKVAARNGDMRLMLQLLRESVIAAGRRLGLTLCHSPRPGSPADGEPEDPHPTCDGSQASEPCTALRASPCHSVPSPQRVGGCKRARACEDPAALQVTVTLLDALAATRSVLSSPYVATLRALPLNCQVVVALAAAVARAKKVKQAPLDTSVNVWANKGWGAAVAPATPPPASIRSAGSSVTVGELNTAFNRVARRKLLDVHGVTGSEFGDLVSRAVEGGMLAVSSGAGRSKGAVAEWGLGFGVGVRLRVNVSEEDVEAALKSGPLWSVLSSELQGLGSVRK